MVNECEVVDCSAECTSSISLHRAPKSDDQFNKQWLCFLNNANRKYVREDGSISWKPKKKAMYVCCKHFKPQDFRFGVSGKKFIIDGHFPSIFNDNDYTSLIINETVNKAVFSESATNKAPEPVPDIHFKCTAVIKAQMKCLANQKERITQLQEENSLLKEEIEVMKRSTIRTLEQKCKRQELGIKRKKEEQGELSTELKRAKMHYRLPDPSTSADDMLIALIERRHIPHYSPYTEPIKTFAFNSHYNTPKEYMHLRKSFPNLLPHPSAFVRWMKDVKVSPGIIPLSVHEIKNCCSHPEKQMYYSLSFDEMAIRQQIIFDGEKMIGRTDFGDLVPDVSTSLAKSALVCLAMEVNGNKAFPLAYVFTDGLKAETLAQIMHKCMNAVESVNGHVLTISFDGLKANFSAAEKLGACLAVGTQNFKPYIEEGDKKRYIIPDASHMMKLVRNTFERCGVIFNEDGQAIRWDYIKRLHDLQEKEELRAANNLTTRHVNFQQKKMNVKLAVQVLSNKMASSIDFCRKINMDGFSCSEATTEFLRVNNMTFDLMNTRPFGKGNKTPLSKHNEMYWRSVIQSAKKYYLGLSIMSGNKLVPIYATKFGTFVKGIVSALKSFELILNEMNAGSISLGYLPTYRLSQDPLELFFGNVRRRLGCNDNPNVAQFTQSVRAMLCFKLNVCENGNCTPQEDLLDRLSTTTFNSPPEEEEEEEDDDILHDIDIESFMNLSLYVENVVVHIAGFVGRKLKKSTNCGACIESLEEKNVEDAKMREDFVLLFEKDQGGLFKPSEDLIRVCKIVERAIRLEQTRGLFSMKIKNIEGLVKRECLATSVFNNLHSEFSSSSLRKLSFDLHCSHKSFLISEICKVYNKVRLHFIAKKSSLKNKLTTTRNKLSKVIHFTGC